MKHRVSRNRAKYAAEKKARSTRALGISIFLLLSRPPLRCCFFRRYSLIAFSPARVSPTLVTFLKLITSAPSTPLLLFLFPRRCGPSVRPRPDVTVSTFSRLLQRFFRTSRQIAASSLLALVLSSSPP